jgi:uncharacterized protein
MNLSFNVLLFGRMLRAAGLDVHHGRLLDAVRALEWVNVGSRTDVAATLRSLLVHDRDGIATFDRAFELFFKAHRPPAPGLPLFSLGERPRVVARPAPGVPVHADLEGIHAGTSGATRAVGAWSAASVSRTKDFTEFTDRELERARTLLERVPWNLNQRRTRRWQRASGGAPDLRPLLRRSVMLGDLVDLPRRTRRELPRPIVLLGDVSGSMERYSRVLVHFVYGLAHSATRVEVFLFATRLTRVTPYLMTRRGTSALARLAREVQDWGGGTRIGEALRTFNLQWARRVAGNGPVVLLISDGWDRGDPDRLAAEMARLARGAHRVIWLNPLLASPDYEPLTRGMLAALPFVDDLLPVHNLVSLGMLAAHLNALPPSRGGRRRSGPSSSARPSPTDAAPPGR